MSSVITGGLPISTHALREEGDSPSTVMRDMIGGFLPTPSARRATLWKLYKMQKL